MICPMITIHWTKGQALVEKAGARMDFSYVPEHLGAIPSVSYRHSDHFIHKFL